MRGLAYAIPARYHLTLHVEGRSCRLGSGSRKLRLSPFGRVTRHYLFQVPQKFLNLRLLASEVRPTGIEALVELLVPVTTSAPSLGPPDPSALQHAVRWFKAMTSAAYARGMQTKGWVDPSGPIWERGYERRLLRTQHDLTEALQRFSLSDA